MCERSTRYKDEEFRMNVLVNQVADQSVTVFSGGLWKCSSGSLAWNNNSPCRDEHWRVQSHSCELFACHRGSAITHLTRDRVAAYLRGYAVPTGAQQREEHPGMLSAWIDGYLATGQLHLDGVEGSFTLTLLDGRLGQILVFRNLGDCHLTYYTTTTGGTLFSSNLVTLLQLTTDSPRENAKVLPEVFLFRSVPGRHTLFDGVRRLGPGQLLTITQSGCVASSVHTLETLHSGPELREDSVDAIEAATAQVLHDYSTIDSSAAVLLSGGVDSSYLQVHWNAARADRTRNATSVAISTNHPIGRLEQEYASTASTLLHTQHCEVAATRPYAEYLVRTIATTGELPNHVQTSYFMTLGDAMATRGITHGLCGQAADALFGSPWGDFVHRARRVKRTVPIAWMRHLLGHLADVLNKPYWARACRLANSLNDLHDVDHPVNHHDTFGDFDAVGSCFGREGLFEACSARRSLLDEMGARDDVLYRVNEVAFVADSYDTCSLWNGLCESVGVELWFPFMDTRVLRVAANMSPAYRFAYRHPKWVLKSALRRHLPADFVKRRKLAFAQPIYEWLAEGGQLRPLVEQIGHYEFVDANTLAHAKETPNAFLYCLLCYDIWHKLFIQNLSPDCVLEARARHSRPSQIARCRS